MKRTLLAATATMILAGCYGTAQQADDVAQAPQSTEGTEAPPPPPPPTPGAKAKPTDSEAGRFLRQASFGPAEGDVAEVERLGYADWLAAQMNLPMQSMADRLDYADEQNGAEVMNLFWEYAIQGDDQLRQRVTFALSQIVVASLQSKTLNRRGSAYANYVDILQRQAFGNYEDLIREVSFNPAMASYLSMVGNRKADPETGIEPDENYAREVMQLFTIGLVELRMDGTSTGAETYTIEDVRGLARVFTGLSWADTRFNSPIVSEANVRKPMVGFPEYHDASPKPFLGTVIDEGSDPVASVNAALDHLLAHPNVPPFVSRRLIQRLVTANPSPAYIERVATAYASGRFEADTRSFGTGRRGDMAATVAAILLDPEARDERLIDAEYGRVRDPSVRLAHFFRSFGHDTPRSRGAAKDVGSLRSNDATGGRDGRPLAPPSVFGFSRVDYVAAGTWTGGAGLAAPGLQVSGGTAMTGYVSRMRQAVTRGMASDEVLYVKPDLTALTAIADDAPTLVAEIDDRLMQGELSESTTARMITAAETISIRDADPEQDRKQRAEIALHLAVTSPEYMVQR